jgi:hypothetical protein
MLPPDATEVSLHASRVLPVLIPAGALLGVAVLLVFRRFSNQQRIRSTKRLIYAHLYELRLFTDEPALVWKAQLALIRENLRYLGMLFAPVLILAIPGFLIFTQLETFYSLAPLAVGRAAIVTVHMDSPIEPSSPVPVLAAPQGFSVETPGVRILAEREVSWRVRAQRAASGFLQFSLPGETIAKRIQAGTGPHHLSERRVRSWSSLLLHPAESRLPASPVDWIEVHYPTATVSWMGLDLPWIVWMLVISGLTVLLLRKRLGVSF